MKKTRKKDFLPRSGPNNRLEMFWYVFKRDVVVVVVVVVVIVLRMNNYIIMFC